MSMALPRMHPYLYRCHFVPLGSRMSKDSEALRLLGGSVWELLPGWLDQAAMELRTKIAREKPADREENV